MKEVRLKVKKEKSVLRKHPWVFTGAIQSISEEINDGEWVKVISNKGDFLGLGHFQDKGSIAVKILSFEEIEINNNFWINRVKNAIQKRKVLGFFSDSENEVFRLIHAEGDLLPGLIVDFYKGVAVLQTYSLGMHQAKNLIIDALKNLLKDDLIAVYDKSSETMSGVFGKSLKNEYLYGEVETPYIVKEHGHNFSIDWITGQKTGFFIDQRENRELLGKYVNGKKVLNTFCYSGGFSIYALDKGAQLVHSLDASQKAIDLVEKNVELLTPELQSKHKSYVADAMDFIKDLPEDYDVIVLDPPAFAKHRSASHKAIQGYKRLNLAALNQIKPGGILFTFSCSQVITKEIFKSTITAAAIESGREISIIHYLSQPADHPINIYHPESEYLKGLVLQVF